MGEFKVLALSKEKLENAIGGLSQLKPILERNCLEANLDGQGKEDARELGEHFQTAIKAMFTVLAFMETKNENNDNEN